jgi:hypothetical protein
VEFDETQSLMGRGFYLCPREVCVANAWKNKKGKTFLKDEKTVQGLVPSVIDILLSSIETTLGRTEKARPTSSIADVSLRKGDILLVREDIPEKGMDETYASARAYGADVFLVPPKMLNCSGSRVIKHDSPKISPILRNLRFYERLSSKGREL